VSHLVNVSMTITAIVIVLPAVSICTKSIYRHIRLPVECHPVYWPAFARVVGMSVVALERHPPHDQRHQHLNIDNMADTIDF
jgi:hypothetical protein